MSKLSSIQPHVGHFISAPWRSSGKSVLSMGLARIAKRKSLAIQTFKKGPDYIDPLWLKSASGAPCYNLDPYLQSRDEWLGLYRQNKKPVVLVEGTMGLHDGLAVDGSDSNAAIAKNLGLPVLLIVDARGMHRSIAALVNGLIDFDPELRFSGIILNRVRSDRHVQKIEQAIEHYCDITVLGAIPEHKKLNLDERELGLLPAPDHKNSENYIDGVADVLEASCDTESLFTENLIRTAIKSPKSPTPKPGNTMYRIGIAQDEAFHFYYEDDLEILRSRGVELIPFSPIRDPLPSALDGLLIGGGFPERHAGTLANNVECRETIKQQVAEGLPVRAECGGLMYLCRSIESQSVVWPMVGVIDGAAMMNEKPQGRGYMKLLPCNGNAPNPCSVHPLLAHEFHHSSVSFRTDPLYTYDVLRGHGIDGCVDGIRVNNVIASYAHFRHTAASPWIDWFLASIHDRNSNAQASSHHV